jgi:hypothetical protein
MSRDDEQARSCEETCVDVNIKLLQHGDPEHKDLHTNPKRAKKEGAKKKSVTFHQEVASPKFVLPFSSR